MGPAARVSHMFCNPRTVLADVACLQQLVRGFKKRGVRKLASGMNPHIQTQANTSKHKQSQHIHKKVEATLGYKLHASTTASAKAEPFCGTCSHV